MRKIAVLLFAFAAGLTAQKSLYLVSQKAASSIAWYTPAGELLATAPVGLHPHEMALSPEARFLYVTDNGTMRIEDAGAGGNTVSIIDVAARKKTGEIPLGRFRRPHGIDIDRRTGRLVVTTEQPDQLLLIDPLARKVVRSFETGGKTAHMVTLGGDARWAWVSNSNSGNVSAIDLHTGAVTLIPTGPRPEGSALSRDGRELYVGNRDGHTVSVIDTSRRAVAAEIATGHGSVRMAVTPDGKHLVCGLFHENAVEVLDLRARKSIAKIPLPEHIVSLNLSLDGKFAFASAEEKDTVFVVSLAARKVARRIQTAAGAHPDPVLEITAR